MTNIEQFIHNSGPVTEWIASYLKDVENFSVLSKSKYGDIKVRLSENPPQDNTEMEEILKDFEAKIVPGITHWQSPRFFAYFPANTSIPSLLAEFITAALGIQGMKWVTSPAATELEERMMEWLRKMIGLSKDFTGVIQDTASVSTLCAILAARERATKDTSNREGMYGSRLRVYCSAEAHSSIEKAVRIAGMGSDNLVKIPVDKECRLIPEELEKAIIKDKQEGYCPTCIVGALGTTGTCAVDPLGEIGRLANKYSVWFHIDAAFAGTALILPEIRKNYSGLELADSFVFNPHKWMFTNFDCSAFFVKDTDQLQKTFQLVPTYLQTDTDDHTRDYSNWGIQLGRRFRSLKLWFVIRSFGVKGIREKLRQHLELSAYFENWVMEHPLLERVVPRNLAVTCFRYHNEGSSELELNRINKVLLESINASGKIYISHTFVEGKYSLRMVIAQTNTEKQHVDDAIAVIQECLQTI